LRTVSLDLAIGEHTRREAPTSLQDKANTFPDKSPRRSQHRSSRLSKTNPTIAQPRRKELRPTRDSATSPVRLLYSVAREAFEHTISAEDWSLPPKPLRGNRVAIAAAFAVLLLCVIIDLANGKGRVKIDVNEPNAVVVVDGKKARIEGIGNPLPKLDDSLITNSLGMKLKLIPDGEFDMGSDASDPDAKDDEKVNGQKHHVRITRAFYQGTTEVTVGQFRQFVEATKYQGDPQLRWRSPDFPQTDEHPVAAVSHNDALAFCEWLSQKEGKTYRLPTEAAWE